MSVAWSCIRPRVPAHSFPLRGASATACAWPRRRTLLTLAIESSCDDTCVAVLDKPPRSRNAAGPPPPPPGARLLFNKKVTSDNRAFKGVHPLTAVESHTTSLAPLVQEALRALPEASAVTIGDYRVWNKLVWVDGVVRQKPDFVAVTRGPGMTSALATGLNTAKGLAAAWDVPLLGVNHMQAHALTPRLVSALERGKKQSEWHLENTAVKHIIEHDHQEEPTFPFLSLLVSGGHTLLVHSRSLTDHRILAQAMNVAIGDMIDKCARKIIPASDLAGMENVMYGPLLEKFAFPDVQSPQDYEYSPPPKRADEIKIFDSGRGWTLTPPLSGVAAMAYDFSGFRSQVDRVVDEQPDMSLDDRRLLARHTMRLVFEHLVSRLLFALKDRAQYGNIKTVVVAGGVASNKYLMHILKSMLEVRGFGHLAINAPPPPLCTDNAAMIAWTGIEMYEAGWRSEMDILALRKWPIDSQAEGGGIMGAQGWRNIKNA
jgi:N6-L-threonylcarbamoyladenine synthase